MTKEQDDADREARINEAYIKWMREEARKATEAAMKGDDAAYQKHIKNARGGAENIRGRGGFNPKAQEKGCAGVLIAGGGLVAALLAAGARARGIL